MEDELPAVLDGVDEPVTVEELEAVVRRAGQRRRARLVAGAAGLLAVGAFGGALAGGADDRTTTGFSATDAPPPGPPATSTMHSFSPWGEMTGVPLTPLFRRDANGVAIRAYRTTWSTDPAAQANCPPPDIVHAGLSNSAAVGLAMTPLREGESFALLGDGGFGAGEGEPATWATVRAGAGVSTVRLRLAGATDAMAPEKGLAVLAVPGSTGEGVVEGLDADGKVVASAPLGQPTLPPDPSCVPVMCTLDGSASPAAPPPTPPATTVPQDAPGALPVPPVTGTPAMASGSGKGVEAVPCPVPPARATPPEPPPTGGTTGPGTVVSASPVTPPAAAMDRATTPAQRTGPATTTPGATTVAAPTTSGAAP